MKKNIKILDCTLRDGGYYTDWNFTEEFTNQYFLAVANSPISIIELGYLSDERDSNGQFYHLNKKALIEAKNILNKNQKIFVMVNFKEVKNFKDLDRLLKEKSKYLDGVRFAVAPKDLKKFTMIISKAAKKYKKISFNLNLMYLSKWFNEEKSIKLIFKNISKYIDTVAFVDSYGALKPDDIYSFTKKINSLYKNKFIYGAHFHNNCGLALANSLVANDNGCKIVDSTFLGMGRGAGNAETELLISIYPHLRKKIKGFYLNNFLEKLKLLKNKLNWGSSFAYAFASQNGYSQAEMMNLIQKRRLDPSTAIEVVSNNNVRKKITFKKTNNSKSLKKLKSDTPVFIGGAKSFLQYGKQLLGSINKNAPIILSGSNALTNFINSKFDIVNPKFLILTGNEINKIKYEKKTNFLKKLECIITEEKFISEKIKKLNNKIIYSNTIAANPLTLLGKLLINLKMKKLKLAFFDGNYENEKEKIIFEETQKSIDSLIKQKINIISITKTEYKLHFTNPWLND